MNTRDTQWGDMAGDMEQLHTYIALQLHRTVGSKQTDVTGLTSLLCPRKCGKSVFALLPKGTSVQTKSKMPQIIINIYYVFVFPANCLAKSKTPSVNVKETHLSFFIILFNADFSYMF